MKTPECIHCEGEHYSTFCFKAPRKKIQSKKPLKSYSPPANRKRIKQKSSNKKPVAIAELDRVFSLYIRVKDSSMGIAKCVTCNNKSHYKSMQNGHFIPRRKMATRWSEVNCHVQCSYCNENLGGNLAEYKKFMINTYGKEKVNELIFESQKTIKLSTHEIIELTDKYNDLLKSALQSTNLSV